MITLDQLIVIMPMVEGNAARYVDPLNAAMEEFMIAATPQRQAAFLANVAHESGELRNVVENTNYSEMALLSTFSKRFTPQEAHDYARQPVRIANRAYANRGGNGDEASGDGWKYRGRGLIQITFRDNYRACGDDLALDLVAVPELLEDPEWAAASAAWYFHKHGCNELADAGNFQGVCGVINCGSATAPLGRINGYESRLRYYTRAMKALS